MTERREGPALLRACVGVFGKAERVHTQNLLEALNRADGKERLTAQELAARLRPFGIRPKQMRIQPRRSGGASKKGYLLADFKVALRREEPPPSLARTPAPNVPSGLIFLRDIPIGPHEPVAYFLVVGNRIKIGYSTNLYARLYALSLRADNIALLLEGGPSVERELHRMFAGQRIGNTEWFSFAGALSEYVNTRRMGAGQLEIAVARGRTRWWSGVRRRTKAVA